MKFLLLVTWFWGAASSSYIAEFEDVDSCLSAVAELTAERDKIIAAVAAREQEPLVSSQGSVIGQLAPSAAPRPRLTAICVGKSMTP